MRRGTRVGQAYVAVTADGSGINEEIVDSVDEAGPGVEKAGNEHGERYGARFSSRFREKLDGLRGTIAERLGDRLASAGDDAGNRAGDRAGSSFAARMVDRTKDLGTRIGDRLADQVGESLGDRIEDIIASALVEVEDLLDRTRSVSGNRGGGGGGVGPTPGRGIGDQVGGLLGAGSRNNALNLFGKAIGGLLTKVGQLQSLGSSMFATFQKGWAEAGEGASTFQRLIAGGGAAGSRAMTSLAASGPAAAAAILVVVGAMSVLISVSSALLAIVTALASTIVSALAGAFLVLGGAMAAAAAAGTLLAVAFTSMTDAQKSLLSDAFQPLHAELTGIGQLMITQMIPYFETWSTNLQSALLLAAPAAAVMGQAFGQAGAALTASLSGPGFQRFSQMLAVYLPSIVQRLAVAFGNLGNGVTAVFAALLPLVNRFSGYLADVTARFSAWANSTQGQNAIVDFADRAVASLQSLWNFVREFSGFIFDVLFSPEAQSFGDGMFDSLADSFERLRDKVSSGDLERWFADAKNFGEQLWKVMLALADVFAALNNSGVLEATALGLSMMASSAEALSMVVGPLVDLVGVDLANAMNFVQDPIGEVARQINVVADAIASFLNLASKIPGVSVGGGGGSWGGPSLGTLVPSLGGATKGNGLGVLMSNQTPGTPAGLDLNSLLSSGNAALNATSVDSGGYKKPKEPKKWVNPYVAWANSLIDEETGAEKIRAAMKKANQTSAKAVRDGFNEMISTLRDINKDAAEAILSATMAENADSVVSALSSVIESARNQATSAAKSIRDSARSTAESMRSAAAGTVETARAALNSAASSLASASTPKAAATALAAVRQAEKDLDRAEKAAKKINKKAKGVVAAAKKNAAAIQAGVKLANSYLAMQEVVTPSNVQGILNGDPLARWFGTLADFAVAREFVAGQLEVANQKLADAIAMRDDYSKTIADGIRAFGALTTAQGQILNGVQQAVTATDIVTNLQERLDKIKKFQDNLRVLLAQGLSNEAYKQILDMGVEGGSAYADALVAGGQGAISATNQLVSSIGGVADQLGLDASNRLYQAGVDAAQGLVDGLNSLSGELDAAATALGNRIAEAVRIALGIHSPSTVMDAMMDPVGDGTVNGLDRQHVKVGNAASRLAGQIAVSPEVAQYASRQGTSATVSGNDPKFVWTGNIITPTEDPHAVATEAINEIVGRL